MKRTHLYLHWVPTLWLYFLSNSLQIATEVHSKSPVSLGDWVISALLSALNSCGEYSYGSFTTWSALIPSYPSLKCDALNNSQRVFASFGKRWKVNNIRFHAISSLKFYLNDMSKLKSIKNYCQGSTILTLTSELFVDQTRTKWNQTRKEGKKNCCYLCAYRNTSLRYLKTGLEQLPPLLPGVHYHKYYYLYKVKNVEVVGAFSFWDYVSYFFLLWKDNMRRGNSFTSSPSQQIVTWLLSILVIWLGPSSPLFLNSLIV